jgi:hypothetical protein
MKLSEDKRLRNCGRPAKHFFRVHYSDLVPYKDNGKYQDVFGFCDDCAKGKAHKIASWGGTHWRSDRRVLHLRGQISHVAPATESECVEEADDKRLHDAKRELLRIMCTKGNADLEDRWEEIFRMALDEFYCRKVMDL